MEYQLIDGLWILDDSGILIFEENYRDWSTDLSTDLIASFLTAILSFANEAFIDAIKFIQFANHRIIFEFNKYALFVIAVSDSSISEEQIKTIIETISDKFTQQFHTILENRSLKGAIRQFDIFSVELEKIVNKEPLSKKLITSERVERLYKKREERRIRRYEEQKRLL